MTQPPKWGRGRLSFVADLESIRADIARAVPLTEIYQARKDRLGIGYSSFCKLVARYAADAKLPTFAAPTQTPRITDAQPGSFGKDYDQSIDASRLSRLTGTKPKTPR